MPVRLTDTELDLVLSAARPLAIEMRDPFLQAVADALAHRDRSDPALCIKSAASNNGSSSIRQIWIGAAR